MESLLAEVSRHGYSILFGIVFLEAVGFPVPAALALVIAGAASATGTLSPIPVALSALSAIILGDTLMFLMGRYTGWWLLGLLCRLSLNPESCVLRSADSFYRRGRTLLIFAKFVPGINTMAPPMAGSMNMRLGQFLRLDLTGTVLYAGSFLVNGFLFSGALETVTKGYQAITRVVSWVLIAAAVGYVAGQVWLWRKARVLRSVPFVSPAEAARALSSDAAVIYDVRSHGYYDSKAMRIQGSSRLDPNALNQFQDGFPASKQIYLYCTCVREATSARVANALLEKGVRSTVIKGGLRAWKKAGLPLEPIPAEEMTAMPVFDS